MSRKVSFIIPIIIVHGSIANRKPFEVPSQRTVWTSADNGHIQFGSEDSEETSLITDNEVYAPKLEKEVTLWESFTRREKFQVILGSIIILLGFYIFVFTK